MDLVNRFGAVADHSHGDRALDRLDDPPGPYRPKTAAQFDELHPSSTRRRAAPIPSSGFSTPTSTVRHRPVSTTLMLLLASLPAAV